MILLPNPRVIAPDTFFRLRVADCLQERALFAMSAGQRVDAVFNRASRKTCVDGQGGVFTLPNLASPLHWLSGEPTVLPEGAGENLCQHSDNFSSWTNNSANVTSDAVMAPDGTLTGDMLAATSGVANARYMIVAFTGDGEKVVSVCLRQGTATRNLLLLNDSTAGAARHQVRVDWTNGVPVLSTELGAGTLFRVEARRFGWYRVSFTATGVIAANQNRLYVYPDRIGTTGTLYAWRAQANDATEPSSEIPRVTAAASRSADTLYFPFRVPPREMTIYLRGYEQGVNATGQSQRTVHIGSDGDGDARCGIYKTASAAGYRFFHDPATQSDTASVGAAVARGDLVEVRGVLSAAGAPRIGVSLNGGAEEVSAFGVAQPLASAWSDARIYLRYARAAFAFTHLTVAAGDRSQDEMRERAGV